MEKLIGAAGGLMVAGLLAGAILGLIIPAFILVGAAALLIWISSERLRRKAEQEASCKLSMYPKYRY